MSSLPHEVHEILEHEYVSMYGPLQRVPAELTPDQILDVQWVSRILRACGLADDCDEREITDARERLAMRFNRIIGAGRALPPLSPEERRRIICEQLVHSPALSGCGQTLIGQYDELLRDSANDEARVELHRRILDDAFSGGVKPLRELRLASLYARLHARAKNEEKARTALCVSGGGIRSATFALGVIQGLASAKILDKFDFVSTVSGGGYIGSWLSSWARRHPHGMAGVQEDLAACDSAAGSLRPASDPHAEQRKPQAKDHKLEPEPQPVRHLRDYSNYLSPRLGLFSGDAWTIVALYVRNLLLNLLVLVPVIALALALPRAYAFFTSSTFFVWPWVYPLGTVLCLLVAFRYIGRRRPIDHDAPQTSGGNADAEYFTHCILPLLGAAIFVTLFWADVHSGLNSTSNRSVIAGAILGALVTTVVPFLSYYRRFRAASQTAWKNNLGDARAIRRHVRRKMGREALAAVIALGSAALVIWLLAVKVFDNPLQNVDELMRIAEQAPADRAGKSIAPLAALYTCFAVPAVLLVFYLQASIFVGLSSHRNEDHDREWWGRGGAWLLITAAGWAALSAIAVFGPAALFEMPVLLGSIGGGAGLIAALLGFSETTPANKKEKEDKGMGGKAGNLALGLTTPLFVVFFLALISLGTTWLTQRVKPGLLAGTEKWESKKYALDAMLHSKAERTQTSKEHSGIRITEESDAEPRVSMAMLRSLAHYKAIQGSDWEVAALIVLAAIAVALSRCIGVNKFSMHALYRNRLIRAYLGASRYSRQPNPFTGFDEKDDLRMYHLRPELLWPMNVIDPDAFFAALRDGQNPAEATGRRRLAQHLWPLWFDTTKDEIRSGHVTHEALDAVVHNLNEILLDETQVLEKVSGLGLSETFWAREKEGWISHPLLLRNRAVVDALFAGLIRPMPRPNDAPSEGTEVTTGQETFRETGKGTLRRGPLHVVNVALNLVSGEKLAWQQRKAAPFTVSPYHSGGAFLGYRDSRLYGGRSGISLGTAVAISGAAASPNMGYHSSPAMAFHLTLFNVRLGWWLGNPGPFGQNAFRYEHPDSNLGPIFSEMLGRTTDRYEWVYLSDGGHFENLGLYEMVLRRCHYIVLSDAGADPEFAFEDLGNAIRKIRTDLGVPIDIEEMFMFPRGKDGLLKEGRYVATATIRYTAVDGPEATDGLLIYVKPGVYQDAYFPRDVFNYATQSATFPHEPTSDQFFSESQFESYRALGRHVINEICCNYPDRESTVRPRIPITKEFASVAQFAGFVEEKARASRSTPPEQVIAQAIRETRPRLRR